MAGTPMAVTDPQMMAPIVEELVAYNPTAGAVFGIEQLRVGHMAIATDDGRTPYVALPVQNLDWSGGVPRVRVAPPPVPNGNRAHSKTDVPLPAVARSHPDIPLLETSRGRPPSPDAPLVSPRPPASPPLESPPIRASDPNLPRPQGQAAVSGEIGVRPRTPSNPPAEPALASASGEIRVRSHSNGDQPPPRVAQAIEVPQSPDEITQPGVKTPTPGSLRLQTPVPGAMRIGDHGDGHDGEARGSILGIGMSHIGSGSVVGEIPSKVPPGARVLVPGPNGLMQSATVRQLLQGYYELEVGSSGETIWVPIAGVVPE
jgi:hypothetical protein